MKKFITAACVLATALVTLFSVSCGNTIKDGVTMRYATVELSYTPEGSSVEKTESIVIEIYTNYAPNTSEKFIGLANDGFYDNTVVNTVENTWFSLGGHTYDGTTLTPKTSGSKLAGEFYNNGFRGNKLGIKKGSVLMYHPYRNNVDDIADCYDGADCRFTICTSTTGEYSTVEYCVFGMIEDEDDLKVLDEIAALRDRSTDDSSDENTDTYRYYYAGGLRDVITKYLVTGDADAGYTMTRLAVEKDLELDDLVDIINGEDGNIGPMDNEVYTEFLEKAAPVISAISSRNSEYFYFLPWSTVTVKSVKITKSI